MVYFKEFEKSKKKRSKYNNQVCYADGHRFHSRIEMERYRFLKCAEKSGLITDLRLQPGYHLYVHEVLICKYIADFAYKFDGVEIIEDVKGVITQVFTIKSKLMKVMYGEVKIINNATQAIGG